MINDLGQYLNDKYSNLENEIKKRCSKVYWKTDQLKNKMSNVFSVTISDMNHDLYNYFRNHGISLAKINEFEEEFDKEYKSKSLSLEMKHEEDIKVIVNQLLEINMEYLEQRKNYYKLRKNKLQILFPKEYEEKTIVLINRISRIRSKWEHIKKSLSIVPENNFFLIDISDEEANKMNEAKKKLQENYVFFGAELQNIQNERDRVEIQKIILLHANYLFTTYKKHIRLMGIEESELKVLNNGGLETSFELEDDISFRGKSGLLMQPEELTFEPEVIKHEHEEVRNEHEEIRYEPREICYESEEQKIQKLSISLSDGRLLELQINEISKNFEEDLYQLLMEHSLISF